MRSYYIYILTNFKNSVFYIGVTNDLERRIYEHKLEPKGFVKRYKLNKLIYFEECSDVEKAIVREKQLKNWHREWKINLIKQVNPEFKDLGGDPEIKSESRS